jgi:hypothetical protein
MTLEHRSLISLGDIVALQFECKQCHAKTTIPISDVQGVPIFCSHCKDPWLVNHRSDCHSQTFTAINKLRELVVEISNNSETVGCVLSVELAPEMFKESRER